MRIRKKHSGLTQRSSLKQTAFLKSLSGDDISLIEFTNNQWRPANAVIDELIDEIIAAGIEVLFFDPMARLHGASENDSSVASAFARALEGVSLKAGCAIVVIHHTGKVIRGGMYSVRGSSGFSDNMSQTIVMSLVRRKERKTLKLEKVLKAHEAAYDIVKFVHERASDGVKACEMFLLRDGTTGMFRLINGDRKNDEDIFGEIIEKVRPWAAKKDGFTKAAFRNARLQFDKELTQAAVDNIYDLAVDANILQAVTIMKDGMLVNKGNRGGALHQFAELLKNSSVPEDSRQSGNLTRNRSAKRKAVKKKRAVY